MAITPKAEMFSNVVSLLPSHITWSNFQNLFSGGRRSVAYFTGLKNSLRAVIVTICIGMPIALVSAYTLSRMEFPGRKIIKNALLITMVIPVMATIIPLYKMFSAGHMLDNTFWLSMVYVSSYLPMATWMIINYFSTIPKELEEAAHIDGCSRGKAFFKIILPLSCPIILSVSLIMFLNTWSQFQIPLILASSMDTKPMAIVVSEFVTKRQCRIWINCNSRYCIVDTTCSNSNYFQKVFNFWHGRRFCKRIIMTIQEVMLRIEIPEEVRGKYRKVQFV